MMLDAGTMMALHKKKTADPAPCGPPNEPMSANIHAKRPRSLSCSAQLPATKRNTHPLSRRHPTEQRVTPAIQCGRDERRPLSTRRTFSTLCACGETKSTLRFCSSFICVPQNGDQRSGDPVHWVCDNGRCTVNGFCTRHRLTKVQSTGNLWHNTCNLSSACQHGCQYIHDQPHHCPRLINGNVIFNYGVFANLFAAAKSIQPSGSAVAFTQHGPIVRIVSEGPLNNPAKLEILAPSHVTVSVAKITYRRVGGDNVTRWAIVMPNCTKPVPIFPAPATPVLMLSNAVVELEHAALHCKQTGWPEAGLDGWNFTVMQALLSSPCARKRWHSITDERHDAGVAGAKEGYQRVRLQRRSFFTAKCAPAMADVDGTMWQCAYCRKQYNNYYMFISKCAPECSKFPPPTMTQ